jgi:hypothetical protein
MVNTMATKEKAFKGNMEVVAEWHKVAAKLKKLKKLEATLRKEVVANFVKPVLGVNRQDLGDGYSLKLTHKETITIDNGMLQAMTLDMEEAGIPIDMLIDRKPTLVKSVYNKLSEDNLYLFDQILIVKAAAPSIEIVENKV